jgi:hypothetical protein
MRMPVDRRGKPRTQLTVATENFTLERTKAVIARRKQDEMLLAKARGEVIQKSLVESQAAYLLDAMQDRIMKMPQTYARRILGLTDVSKAHRILKELSIALLNELKDLPQVVNPNWLREVEREGRQVKVRGVPSSNAA